MLTTITDASSVASPAECRERVEEIVSLIETEIRGMREEEFTIPQLKQRIDDLLRQTVTRTDESRFVTEVTVRPLSWEDLYPNATERGAMRRRAFLNKLRCRANDFKVPGGELRINVVAMPRVRMVAISGGLTLSLTRAESKA